MKQPVLCVTGLKKKFQNHIALDSIEFSIETGQVVVIVGPSGAGKTTLLRSIALLTLPDAGKIDLFGTTVFDAESNNSNGREADLRVQHRHVLARTGIVFQSLNLWPHRTVLQNVTDPLVRVRGMSREEAEPKAVEQLDKLGLSGKESRRPDSLSGGEKQRVALARALVSKPDLLLLDEITSALDFERVADLLALLRKLATSAITLLLVTHEISFAAEVAHQLIFMEAGRVVEIGQPHDLLTHPRTKRVRDFVSRIRDRYANSDAGMR